MTREFRILFRRSAAIAAGLALASPALGQDSAQGGAQQAGLEQQLDAALQAPVERGDIPMAVGAITNAEETIYSGAFGERELGSGEPVVYGLTGGGRSGTGLRPRPQ